MQKIPLGNNQFALVNDEDALAVCLEGSWYLHNQGYAYNAKRSDKSRKRFISLHEFIIKRMNLIIPKGYEIDHINRNKLDCTRNNLRIVTKSENSCNKEKRINSSGHKGITWHKKDKMWQVQCRKDGKYYYGGSYKSLEEAIKIRNNLYKELHHDFMVT